MWPELIPFLAVMIGGVYAPHYIHGFFNILIYKGHTQARNQMLNIRDFYGFRRDEHLVGSVYKAQGLEAIPDATD